MPRGERRRRCIMSRRHLLARQVRRRRDRLVIFLSRTYCTSRASREMPNNACRYLNCVAHLSLAQITKSSRLRRRQRRRRRSRRSRRRYHGAAGHELERYLYRRQHGWARHVARVDWTVRMPRKRLSSWSSWIQHDAWGAGKRPACGQMKS